VTEQTKILVELGVEEIPGRMMEDALDQLEVRAGKWAMENRLNPTADPSAGGLETYGTPRRLVVVGIIRSRQREETESLKGPPEDVAYEDGEPTRALEGFCRQHDLSPEDVEVEAIDGGRYVTAEKTLERRPAPDVLKESFDEVFLGLDWPKSMRWEKTRTRFIRPIRWILAACNGKDGPQFLDLDVGPVSSTKEVHGLRFTDQRTVQVRPSDLFGSKGDETFGYPEFLRERTGVLLSPVERREKIKKKAEKKARKVDGEPVHDSDLLDEVTHLVEEPTPFRGSFDERFLKVPDEVLVESMQSHQKYLPVQDRQSGDLLPHFIGVRNGGEKHLETVVEGNEKVLRARLNDAEFFYNQDLETGYEEYRDDLKGIVFQEELGSLHEKTERLAELIERTTADGRTDLSHVARHAKNDLVTDMVEEFPKLQGTMGRIYAEESGWNEDDVTVIEEHHRPRGRDDRLPEGEPAQWLALLDRLDTLVGFFGLGERPTGSTDPYGLRRDALSVLRILLDGNLEDNVDLKELMDACESAYGNRRRSIGDEHREDLESFFERRLLNLAESDSDYFEGSGSTDEFHRVLRGTVSVFWNRPSQAEERYEWIAGQWMGSRREEFMRFVEAYQRADSILGGEDDVSAKPNPDRFEDESEPRLHEAVRTLNDELDESLAEGNDDRVLKALVNVTEPVNEFFESVMVHADDSAVRVNRLRLLDDLVTECNRVADFSAL
jgi:glycyl-tRNA synthetase beta chain